MTYCATCDLEVTNPRTDLHPKHGVIRVCAAGHILEAPEARIPVTQGSGFVDNDGEDVGAVQFSIGPTALPVARVAAAVEKSSKRALQAIKRAESLAARDALKEIRARRRSVRVEIKRLEALRREDDELAAAERAIEASRRAQVVRPLARKESAS